MSSFTSELMVSPMMDGKFWKLLRPFSYRIGSRYSNQIIKVPIGTLTDFASIPPIFWFLPSWAKFSKASVLHDLLYREQKIMGEAISRKEADDIFLEAMLIDFSCHKVGGFVAYLEYTAVRVFALKAWRNYEQG
jgi:hypothetical protein